MRTLHRWLCACLFSLASVGLACARTDLQIATPPGTGGTPAPATLATEDAALHGDASVLPDTAALSVSDATPDLRSPLCGNGRLDPGEDCDDGNTLSGDGCDQLCQLECSYTDCPWPPYGTRTPVCGDGILSFSETCEDHNTNPGDGCSSDCKTIEPGYRCSVPGMRCTPICGDGAIRGPETCDDGNLEGGDGCSDICLTEPGWDCGSGICLRLPPLDGGQAIGYCGDGTIEGAEECDNGPLNVNDYGHCGTHCLYLRCGDGIVNGPEECDLGQSSNNGVYGDRSGCTRDCTRPHYCGDGIVDSVYGEMCDFGDANGISGSCLRNCLILLP